MLELRQLKYFLTVAEELNVTAAARRLRMAQPALSQALSKMERQLGTPLFDRSGGRLTLTAAGRLLLPEARTLVTRAEEVSAVAAQATGRGRVVLRIGCITSAVSGLLPRVLPAFLRQHPWVVPRVSEMGQEDQVSALSRDAIDIGVCRMLRSEKGGEVRVLRLGDEPLRCAVPEGHRLARADGVALGDLADEPLVMFPRSMAPVAYDAIVSACMRAGVSPLFTQEARNDQSILGFVACGVALALVPDMTTFLRIDGVRYLPVTDPGAVTPLSVVVRGSGASEVALLFRDALAAAWPDAPPR